MFLDNKRILFFNPPGKLYQRGEDRCQGEVETSSAMSLRPPNDLGYMAAVARGQGWQVTLRDYPADGKTLEEFISDLKGFSPAVIVSSITGPTLEDDMEILGLVKEQWPSLVTVAKGAYFSVCPQDHLEHPVFEPLDLAIKGEAETILPKVLDWLIEQSPDSRKDDDDEIRPTESWKSNLCWLEKIDIEGVLVFLKDEEGQVESVLDNGEAAFLEDLDSLPFPARDLIRNELYPRPDTGTPQATIQVSRGCPSACTFCLSPVISGKGLRRRSVQNVVAEIGECMKEYGIKDFFFRADTFTMDKKWVIELCQEIKNRGLKVSWAANSRVDTIDEERLSWMKEAGCWLVAFGFEAANPKIQEKVKKKIDREKSRQSVDLCRKLGIKTYGFFLIGLPWESEVEIRETLAWARELKCDFNEVHMAIPFEGTELYRETVELGLLSGNRSVGHNYFSNPPTGTLHLSREQVMALRKEGLRSLYLNPRYIWRTLGSVSDRRQLANYCRYGWRLLKNLIGK